MKTYLLRAGAYCLKLILLVAAIYALMYYFGTAAYSLRELSGSLRGVMLLAAIVLLSLLYPKIGFITRRVELDMAAKREEVLRTMHFCGYMQTGENGQTLTFRADSPLRRLLMTWHDAVTMNCEAGTVILTGPRKHVSRIEYRLGML